MDEAYGGPVQPPGSECHPLKALDYTGIQTICGSGTITPHDIIRVGFMGKARARGLLTINLSGSKGIAGRGRIPGRI